MEFDPTIVMRLAERGKQVPGDIHSKALDAWDKALSGKPVEDGAVFEIAAWLDSYFEPLLVPGPDYESDAPADWKPRGHADGVLYLAGIRDAQNQDRWIPGIEGLQRTALRYLRPASPVECATRMALEGRDRISGFAVPRLTGLYQYCPGIGAWKSDIEEDRRHGEEVFDFFTISDAAIDAVQPAHRNRWVVKKPEFGIWAIFYV